MTMHALMLYQIKFQTLADNGYSLFHCYKRLPTTVKAGNFHGVKNSFISKRWIFISKKCHYLHCIACILVNHACVLWGTFLWRSACPRIFSAIQYKQPHTRHLWLPWKCFWICWSSIIYLHNSSQFFENQHQDIPLFHYFMYQCSQIWDILLYRLHSVNWILPYAQCHMHKGNLLKI